MSDKKQLEKIRGMSLEKQVIRKIEQSAYEYEWLYGGCGRSTLRALQEGLGIDDGDTFRAQPPPFPEGLITISSAEPWPEELWLLA